MNAIVRFFTLFLVLTAGAVLAVPPALYAQPYSQIVAFGDSLTDFGGIAAYNDDFPDSIEDFPQVQTNDRVWVQYLADEWGAGLDNNAIGGAETDRHTSEKVQAASDAGLIPDLGYLGQVDTYVDGDHTIAEADTLFVVWIGGNDFLGFDFNEGDAGAFVSETLENISTGLTDLAVDAGARIFLVLNLPDMGKIPEFNDNAAVAPQASALARDFNAALDDILVEFRQSQGGIQVYRFDVFSYMNQIIASGEFENTTGTYLELDEDGDWTGDYNGDADEFIFWDEIHPTDRVHEMLGNEAAGLEASAHIVTAADLERQTSDDDTAAGPSDDDDDETCFISITGARLFGLFF